MDRIKAAAVFLETISKGSISGAATQLNMSRAMATRYISVMEEWAGVRLLHRTTRKLSLTAAGEELVPICQQMLMLSQDITTISANSDNNPSGMLRITSSSIFAEYCLTDALSEFLTLYPKVSIDLQVSDDMTNLAEEGIDLAIRVTRQLDPGVIAKPLGQVETLVCASPDYLTKYGHPHHPNELKKHNCITYSHLKREQWLFTKGKEQIQVPVAGNFITSEAALVVRAALNGSGVAFLPRFAAQGQLDTGRLIALFPDYQQDTFIAFAVYLSRHHMPSALRTLIDFLSESLPLPNK